MSRCNHNYLVLKSVKHPYYCQRCGQLGFGKSYSCENSECNVFYHKQCEDPKSMVKHQFSTKCIFQFYKSSPVKLKDCLCHVCGNRIDGYHYRCSCAFTKRYAHPHCLSHEPTLEAFDGLTMELKKVATEKCLYCGKKDISRKVDGWAYVSSCGKYCYHVSCVMTIINENWKSAFLKGTRDPFQIIKDRFPKDMNAENKLVRGKRNDQTSRKKRTVALNAILNVLTGNYLGLVSDANSYFR